MKNLQYKSVENSKNTSGEGGNNPAGGSGQLTETQLRNLIQVAADMGCSHFQNHFYMDTNAQMAAKYSHYAANFNLRTLEQDTQLWADICHEKGMKVVYRGTWSAIKNNNDFGFATYGSSNFVPLGTVAGAATEGETTYCGKMWRFLNVNINPDHLEDGDIIAPVSEATEFLANANMIWFTAASGVQPGFYNFFLTLQQVVEAFGASIGKTLGFFTIVNFSEYYNFPGHYLDNTLPNAQNLIPIDYYGHGRSQQNGTQALGSEYVFDWNALYAEHGTFPIYQTEMGGIFGDSWPTLGIKNVLQSPKVNTYEEAAHYQMRFWQALRDGVVDPGKMIGLSNWGFWSGQNSSIVRYVDGVYKLNYMGQIYANFLKGNGMGRVPVPSSLTIDSWGNRSNYF